MIYATCLILPEENSEQIAAFLQHHYGAPGWSKLVPQSSRVARTFHIPKDSDGFFYTLAD